METFPKLLDTPAKRDFALIAWVAALATAACGIFAVLLATGHRLEHPVTVAVLVVLAVAAEHQTVRLSPYCEASVGSLMFVFAAVTLGPLAAAVVGGAGLLVDLP